MCEVTSAGDTLVFSSPELELALAYLTARNMAEKIELREGALYISPALPELAESLKVLCVSDVSTLLLDVKEALLHLGWLVDGVKDVKKIRKSRRVGVSDLVVVEYDKLERKLSVFTTRRCLAQFLKQEAFEVSEFRHMLEAWKKASSLVEAIELGERVLQTC
ncbi:MAG: hypothetical protein ACK4SY_01840 [Pyrobaculum sp.]